MKEYNIKMMDHAPMCEKCWSRIEKAPIDECVWMDAYKPVSYAQVAYVKGDGFYARLTCEEKNPKAVHEGFFADVYKDSCLEMFAKWDDASDKYINIEMNSNGASLIALGADRHERSRIDQLCGQWHADLCGLGEIFDSKQTDAALESMWRYNFKPTMRDFVNPWRVFVVGDEAGSIMCDYPQNVEKPAIPVPYCEECMTGFEYELAGLWAAHGQVDRAVTAVRAVRDRYDGAKRNPYNEIECGNNYARAMASFALLPILSGMQYDMSRGHLGFDPLVNQNNFNALFAIGHCWGQYQQTDKECALRLQGGDCTLRSLGLPSDAVPAKVLCDDKEIDFTFENNVISFAPCTFERELRVKFVK